MLPVCRSYKSPGRKAKANRPPGRYTDYNLNLCGVQRPLCRGFYSSGTE